MTMRLLVSLCFFSAIAVAEDLPEKFSCSGTEPFWGFQKNGKNFSYDMMGQQTKLKDAKVEPYHGMPSSVGVAVRTKIDAKKKVTLYYIVAAGCSDGMSERKYKGYGVMDVDGKQTFYGCCDPTGEK